MRLFPVLGLASAALLSSLVACSPAADATVANDDSDVIGGVDAKSAALDAVGAILYDDTATGTREMLCTATLIGPRTILSAKHCAEEAGAAADPDPDGGAPQGPVTSARFIDQLTMYFATGSDTKAPKRLVKLESVDVCSVADGGFMGLGCDVSVYRLAEAIDDITPLAVLSKPLAASAIGKKMSAVGYGNQVQVGSQYGTRKAGTLTVRAVTGAPLAVLYPTVDGFLDALRESEGADFVTSQDASLRALYAAPLLDGYEAWTGAADGDAQVCHGDSGGPLLAKVGGKLVVQGVASGVVAGVKQNCQMGAAYGVFGPQAQAMIQKALKDPCEGVPAAGRCDGNVAVRCTTAAEGPRRITRTDCAALLQRCIVSADGDAGAAPAAACGD